MKLVKTVFMVFVLLIIPAISSADYTVERYEALMGDWSNANLMELYFNGLGSGFEWSNLVLERGKQKKLYCQPDDVELNTRNYISIIDNQITKKKSIYSKQGKEADFKDVYIEVLLLYGLKERFPCK
jgi:hypothetical protein